MNKLLPNASIVILLWFVVNFKVFSIKRLRFWILSNGIFICFWHCLRCNFNSIELGIFCIYASLLILSLNRTKAHFEKKKRKEQKNAIKLAQEADREREVYTLYY